MAFARQFDGIDDRLDTGLSLTKGSTNSVSMYCWFEQAALKPIATLFGLVNFYSGNERLQLRAEFQNPGGSWSLLLDMWGAGVPNRRFCTIALPGTGTGRPVFVAYVNDVTNNRARFYWGFSAAGIVEVDTSEFFEGVNFSSITAASYTQVTDPAIHLNIGACGREVPLALGTLEYFTGIIDTVGIEFDTELSLDDLKSVAQCGVGAGATYYWPIDGTDPEPGISVIYGTTVVDSICDAIPPVDVLPDPADAIASTLGPTQILSSMTVDGMEPADVIGSTLIGPINVEDPPPPPPPPPPTGDDFIPKACPESHLGGTLVTITGTNFVQGQTEVFFNKPTEPGLIAGQELLGWLWDGAAWVPLSGGPSSAVVVFISSTQIQVTVPAWVTPSTLTIRTPGGSGTTTETFSCGMPSVSPSWWRNEYRPGDAGAVCDRCGFRYWLSELSREWTGLKVCSQCFENRHPQDFVRAVRDGKAIREPRREQEPVFVSPGDITADDL